MLILCGGFGKRLKFFDTPKVLAKIGEKTFLDILINNLLSHGFENIILCVGYLKEQIKKHVDRHYNLGITFSEEEVPLGTGGALKNAMPLIKSDPFVVMNGDSFCNVNFRDFFEFHVNKNAFLSMVLARAGDTQDCGTVVLNGMQRITSFREKAGSIESLVNAGIYLMQKDIFSYMPRQDHFSLEYDIFPEILNNRCYGFLIEGKLIDIGTPERYKTAMNLLKAGGESNY